MNRIGLGARLALAFAALAALTALVTAGVSAASTSRKVNADVDRFLQSRSIDIAEGRRAAGRGPRQERITERLVDALVDADADVQVLDRNGEVTDRRGAPLPISEAEETLLRRQGAPIVRTIEIDGEQYRMVTRHIPGGGLVQVAQSLTTTNTLLGDVQGELIVVGLIMSGIAGVLGWAIAQGTTRPLRRLTKQVESVAATQDLSVPLTLDRGDEIGRLSEEFDALLKTVAASRDQQQRLVQDAAHELRTPLTSVRANIDFLSRAKNLDEADRQSTLASIRTELAELSGVLAEVVELATETNSNASFEPLDLVTVAEAALAQFELRTGRPVVRELASSTVHGDHSTLVRAAQNLLANADKYSPAGSTVTVWVANGSLSVKDNGPGIEPEDHDRIFDRFYRSDRDRSAPGSGLGLAIVAKAAHEHGGQPWARNAPDGGAEVGFTVPEAV